MRRRRDDVYFRLVDRPGHLESIEELFGHLVHSVLHVSGDGGYEVADAAAVLAANLLVPTVERRGDDFQGQRAVEMNLSASAHTKGWRTHGSVGQVDLPILQLERATRFANRCEVAA